MLLSRPVASSVSGIIVGAAFVAGLVVGALWVAFGIAWWLIAFPLVIIVAAAWWAFLLARRGPRSGVDPATYR